MQAVLDAIVGWRDVEDQLAVGWTARFFHGILSPKGSERYGEAFLLRAGRHPRPVYRITAVEYGSDLESVVVQGLRDRFWRVRWTAAQSTVAPPDMLAELVHDTSAEVRSAAAGNVATPLAALWTLLDDRVLRVREAAARNESLGESDLRRVSQHRDPGVRCVVARRTATPVDVLDALALDDDLSVAEAVGRNERASSIALHRVVRRTSNSWTMEHIAVRPQTRLDDLLYLIDRGDPSALMAMAKRSSVPEALHALAQLDDALVRAAVLTNPCVKAETLMVMPLDAPVAEHRAAAAHPNATWATCRRLAVHYLSSGHPGRRNIGVEMVANGMAKSDASTATGAASIDEPFDIVFALFTGQLTDDLLVWAKGTTGPKWLRDYVLDRLSM